MAIPPTEDLHQMIQALPVGIISFGDDGTIGLRNAMATQLLVPLLGEPALDNLYFALRHLWPGLAGTVARFAAPAGTIVQQHSIDGRTGPRRTTLSVSITRLSPHHCMASIRDITRLTDMTAFAFAGSDLLIDVDAEGAIVWAAGSFGTLFEKPPGQFIGLPLKQLIAPRDQEGLDRTLLASSRGRLAPIMLRLANPRETRCILTGLAFDGPVKRFFITISRPPEPEAMTDATLKSAKDFEIEATGWVRGNQPAILGMLDVENWEGTLAGLDQSHRDSLLREIGRLAGDGGNDALVIGEVAAGRFGVLGPADTDLERLGDALRHLVANFSPTGQAVVHGGTVDLDANGLTLSASVQALRLVLSRFATSGVDTQGLAGGLSDILEQANQQKRDLAEVIAGGHFTLLYQPVVTLADKALHHMEALLRPSGSVAKSPQEFVTLVEAVGLSVALDLAVIRRAVQAVRQSSTAIAVNISGLSIAEPLFTDAVLDAVSQVPAGQILIELTETAEIEDLPAVAERIARIRSAGIPVCLDDFGAGSASFRYLRELRVDMVKIDGAYVQAAVKGEQGRAFVGARRELATSTKAETIAEMVETEAQRALMLELGVHYGQGWLFGKPAPLPPARAPTMIQWKS